MKITRNIGIILLGTIVTFISNLGYCLPVGGPINPEFVGESTPIIEETEVTNINQGGFTFTEKLKGILHLPQKDDYPTSLGYVLSLIKISVNRTISLLATVALVYLLYSGFLILSSGDDDKNASKGKKGISTAAIALAGIALSWLIISAMIRFIEMLSK